MTQQMRNILFTLILLLFAGYCHAQKAGVRYYNSKYEEVDEGKARYVKTVTNNADGTTTIKEVDLKNGEEISNYSYKGNEPYGLWSNPSYRLIGRKKDKEKLDYNFELVYDKDVTCKIADELAGVTQVFADDVIKGYKAPQLTSGQQFFEFIGRNIHYPHIAKEQGIQGRVEAKFTITANGDVEDIVIVKSVHIALDKEYARVLRKAKFTPATIKGKPVALCLIMPTNFQLD